MAANCSNTEPFSQDYLQELTTIEKVAVGISTGLCVGVFLLFADKVWFILHHYGDRRHERQIKRKSLVLVGLYPVTAVTSLLGLFVPRSTLICDFISTSYFAVCLYNFMGLLVLYCGGKDNMIHAMETSRFNFRTGPCCCCCRCCPAVPISEHSLGKLRVLTLQTAFVRPAMSLLSVVLWVDGKFDNVEIYMSFIMMASMMTAMYGLIIIFKCTRQHLASLSIVPKFMLMKLVLVGQNFQRLLVRLAIINSLPACGGSLPSIVRADAIHHELLIVEMFLMAFFARVVYRRPISLEKAHETIPSEDDVSLSSYDAFDHDSFLSTKERGQSYGAVVDTAPCRSIDEGIQSSASDDGDLHRCEATEVVQCSEGQEEVEGTS